MTDRQRKLRQQQWIKLTVFIGFLLILALGLALIENLLLSFVLAVVISYLISPLISYLEATGISRLIAILIVYSFFTSLAGLTIWALTPFIGTQLSTLKISLPDYVDGTVNLFNKMTAYIENTSGGLFQVDFSDRLRIMLTNFSGELVDGLPGLLSSSAAVLFLSPILGFFILKDGRQLLREVLKLVPNHIFELAHSLQDQISEQIAHYIRARLLEALIVGLICLVGFLAIGFPYPFLLAAFAGLTNLIPYIGPIFGAIPGLILAALSSGFGVTFALVFMIYFVAQLVDNLLLIPLVVARIVNLHPITVVLSVLFGAQTMGVLGMFISIPLVSALKVTFTSIYSHLTDYSG